MGHFKTFSAFIQWIEHDAPKFEGILEKEQALKAAIALINTHALRPQVPIITVTGTNGKGSTVQALETLFLGRGLHVGSFTSPHLLHYGERFRINGKNATEADILTAANQLYALFDLKQFNFFYIIFFIGLLLFQKASLDVLVLEVGLGGRLDPTNTLDADILILTQVALDHTHWLGTTREAIALEKAGLLRQKQIFICGEQDPPEALKEKVAQMQCTTFWRSETFESFLLESHWGIALPYRFLTQPCQPILHASNLLCAVLAFEHLLQTKVHEKELHTLSQLALQGRCERIFYQGHEIILDVAHNPAAVENLTRYLNTLSDNLPTDALFGAMEDKDIPEMVRLMEPYIETWFLTDLPTSRAAKAENIQKIIKNAECFSSTQNAFTHWLESKKTQHRLVVFGSFLTVSAIKNLYTSNGESKLN